MGEQQCDDGASRTLPNGMFRDSVSGADGDGSVPANAPFGDVPQVEDVIPAWEFDASAGSGPDEMPDPGPDWPPDAIPVFLWPEEVLRQALRGAPGLRAGPSWR